MMSRYMTLFLLLGLCLGLITACDSKMQSTPQSNKNRPDTPDEYSHLENPLAGNPEAETSGRDVYRIHCVMCHGENGAGDGPAAMSLNPKPESFVTNQDQFSDAYLFWRISEGGLIKPFSSAMPSWKSILSEEEIWQVISHLRTLMDSSTSS